MIPLTDVHSPNSDVLNHHQDRLLPHCKATLV
jgi:hypothetical protein